ncbi:MAG: hypothetical protein Q8Q09_14145 [Deltaproteobacteria bacterium]|nr:hypothetical protein [Deltaproteobacteria bacterium]
MSHPIDETMRPLATLPWIVATETAPPTAPFEDTFEVLALVDPLAPALALSRSTTRPGLLCIESPDETLRSNAPAQRSGSCHYVWLGPQSHIRLQNHWIYTTTDQLVVHRVTEPEVAAQELGPAGLHALFASLAPLAHHESAAERSLRTLFGDTLLDEQVLAHAVTLAERGGPVLGHAAAAMVARLHSPTAPREALERLDLATSTPLIGRVWSALDTLDAAAQQALRVEALACVSSATKALHAWIASSEQDHPATRAMARRWLVQREHLACVLYALGRQDSTQTLAISLAELDALALSELSRFASEGPYGESDLLTAVAWIDPDAWWAALAL